MATTMIHVLAMLHAGIEGIEGLRDYESRVIPIMSMHGGRLLSAFRPNGNEHPEIPDEIHLIEFPSEEAFQSYRSDPEVARLAERRGVAISKTAIYVSQELLDYKDGKS